MATSNIKQFDELTGKVFGALYERFPVPHDLNIKDFVDDELDTLDQERFFIACVQWLSDAGYLRFFCMQPSTGFPQAVLTTKGLEVLKALPDSLKTGPTLGDQLVDASKSGAKSLLGSIAGQALSIGTRIATTQFGLPG